MLASLKQLKHCGPSWHPLTFMILKSLRHFMITSLRHFTITTLRQFMIPSLCQVPEGWYEHCGPAGHPPIFRVSNPQPRDDGHSPGQGDSKLPGERFVAARRKRRREKSGLKSSKKLKFKIKVYQIKIL